MNNIITNTCREMSQIAIMNNMTAERAKVIAFRTHSIDNGIVKAAMINELKKVVLMRSCRLKMRILLIF